MFESTEINLDVSKLSEVIPTSVPRYHIYRYNHSHEGDYQEAIGKLLMRLTISEYLNTNVYFTVKLLIYHWIMLCACSRLTWH